METDMLGNPVQVGDYVLVVRKGYRDLVVARVLKFTPKNIKVVYPASWTNDPYPETYMAFQIVKVRPDQFSNSKKIKVDTVFAEETGQTLEQVS